jgi:putative transposase
VSRQVSPSANRAYGVLRVTRVWRRSRATLYRHRCQCDEPRQGRRPGPLGPMPDPVLVTAIRELLANSPFHGEAIARSGRGCASPGFAPPNGGCSD